MLYYVTGFLYSLSHPHVLVSIFGITLWVFQQQFSSLFSASQRFTSFRFLYFVPGFYSGCVMIFAVVSWFLSYFIFTLAFLAYEFFI